MESETSLQWLCWVVSYADSSLALDDLSLLFEKKKKKKKKKETKCELTGSGTILPSLSAGKLR